MNSFLQKIFFNPKKPQNKFRKSFSQDGEDMILSSLFDDLGGRKKGFYIDIGALHPFRFSNTAHFYDIGWNGINIEPTPTAIKVFNRYRKRDINLNFGIADKEGSLVFYCFDEPALNSFSKEISLERNETTHYKIIDTIKIPVFPLHQILHKYLPQGVHIDFLNIDVEGLDIAVLQSNDWDKYIPEFILIEDIINVENLTTSNVYNFLIIKGYALKAKTERTMIFHYAK